ncbi:unnamed protein product, partial [Sphenostylis stenocarpa]
MEVSISLQALKTSLVQVHSMNCLVFLSKKSKNSKNPKSKSQLKTKSKLFRHLILLTYQHPLLVTQHYTYELGDHRGWSDLPQDASWPP